jgi:hypothetical protein
MSLPLWDPIELPPDTVCVDINSIEPESLRVELQAEALAAYLDDEGVDDVVRDWSDDEAMFAVYEGDEIVGVVLIVGVEDA